MKPFTDHSKAERRSLRHSIGRNPENNSVTSSPEDNYYFESVFLIVSDRRVDDKTRITSITQSALK